jgi:hypothetical protein
MRVGTRYVKLVFLHLVRYAGHVAHSRSFGAQNNDALFFMLGWTQSHFHKKPIGTHYTKLIFLHLVGSAGHLVHCIASRV